MSDTAIRVRITGRVQGVGFRAWTKMTADGLGLTGWVRNTDDGAVEAEFRGAAARVEEMQARLGQGPRGAQVRKVLAETVPPQGSLAAFLILR